ncbi:MAG: VWA domain-containing protein [SAR324 cluster bacterium]|nr:VWA domain-containing protein [SAR324 cluster bacterium]
MKKITYQQWDGSQQPFSLNKKEVSDRFFENIFKGMSPGMSMAQMMWEGFSLESRDFRVMGLEEMVAELEKQKNELLAKYTLEHAFDKPYDELEFAVENENFTRAVEKTSPIPSFNELEPGLLEKLHALETITFSDPESQEIFSRWRKREKDISDLYEFYSEYAHFFTGAEPMDFEQAVTLMRQAEAMNKLQQQILSGDLSRIDLESLEKLLGENAGDSLNILIQLPRVLKEEGLIEQSQGRYEISPRGMRSLGELAFGQIYRQLKRDKQGGQQGNAPQTGEIEPDSSRRYQYGDRFDPDITRTILKSVSRHRQKGKSLNISPDDFYVREREQLITSTIVVLLDLSWSMSIGGRFEAAKKVTLALHHYIKTRFPKDKIHIIGFSTEARELKERELSQVVWDVQRPFTNLQGGLRLAMKLIKRSGNRNNRVLVITDGQPTAYYLGNELHAELPDERFGISANACRETLIEVKKVTAQGMNIETFLLDQNPALVEFGREVAKINRGRAVLCIPDELGKLMFLEEVKRRNR